MAMWISAALHWLIMSPGMYEQHGFPAKLFFARFAVLSPLSGWAGAVWFGPCGAVVGATLVAFVTDIVILIVQAVVQDTVAKSSGRNKY